MSFSCYLCGSFQGKTVAEPGQIRFGCFASDKRVIQCASCGLVQLSPRWTRRELDTLYATYWKKQDFEGQKIKTKISTYLKDMIRPGDLAVEIGSGRGHNVRYLKEAGLNVRGIDKDASVCDGKDVVHADVTKIRLRRKADFIFAIHLLEHLPDPRWFLGWIRDNLKEGGRFALEVPNADDPLRVIYKNNGFKKFCWYPYHMFYFTRDTMRALFDGFPEFHVKTELMQEYGILNHLRWGITGKPGNALPTIPILDAIYKFVLTRILGVGDTLVVIGSKA